MLRIMGDRFVTGRFSRERFAGEARITDLGSCRAGARDSLQARDKAAHMQNMLRILRASLLRGSLGITCVAVAGAADVADALEAAGLWAQFFAQIADVVVNTAVQRGDGSAEGGFGDVVPG